MEADLSGAEEARRYAGVSFWFDSLPAPVAARGPLDRDVDCDVAIVGAGFTGLWTAYYLQQLAPDRSIVVLEREVAGFGASGRNGGWCSALFATSLAQLARLHGLEAAQAMRGALEQSVDEVGAVARAEGIDCHYVKSGAIVALRSPAQLARTREEIAEARALGVGEDDLRLLEPEEAAERIGATRLLGATYSPHCAAIHPARLARGLADVVERRGARIYEQTAVRAITAGRVETATGTLRARTVVRATEAYTAQLPGSRRDVAPVYSLMLATEPLPAAAWEEIGLAEREVFADHRHLIVYGQRTADGRIAFGGRGAPYHFGSRIRPELDRNDRVHDALRDALVGLFPVLEGAAITHRWGGPLGIPRDWYPSVGYDPAAQLAWAQGYVGDGVATTNLAGRTLAALVSGVRDARSELCWVGHRSPRWEPEPLRYLGVNLGLALMTSADRAEERTGRPARRAVWFGRFIGG